jgi:hypothetical protein
LRNIQLSSGTVQEIDNQVSKILKGLGNPEPPLDLEAVYKLLKLDPQFYRTSEDGVVRETISRVKVGAKLIFENPTRIWDAIKKADLKALYIPEQRRILIDGNLHELKIRWNGAHEIGHSILDWHQDYVLGDDQHTLLPFFHEQIEAEANHAAGRLLFLQERFGAEVKGTRHSLSGLGKIAKSFGNSWTSTVYRTVTTLDVPAFAIIGSHPHHSTDESVRHFVSSQSFAQMFPAFTESGAESILRSYCKWTKKGPLGNAEFALDDARGDRHRFFIESFGIPQGDVLTLAQYAGSHSQKISVSR